VEIYTIGFTKKTAGEFFELLKKHEIDMLMDVRISNMSQLAGFTRREDLRYFLGELAGAEYIHEPRLAPTPELLKAYRSKTLTWSDYEGAFLELMSERQVEESISRNLFNGKTVLLCSEATPERCHRRLVVEYLDRAWGNVQAVHL
jgi:uncharacterized protein (DUF488 family)